MVLPEAMRLLYLHFFSRGVIDQIDSASTHALILNPMVNNAGFVKRKGGGNLYACTVVYLGPHDPVVMKPSDWGYINANELREKLDSLGV